MEGQTDGWMDAWMDGQMEGRKDGGWVGEGPQTLLPGAVWKYPKKGAGFGPGHGGTQQHWEPHGSCLGNEQHQREETGGIDSSEAAGLRTAGETRVRRETQEQVLVLL